MITINQPSNDDHGLTYYLGIYFALCIGAIVFRLFAILHINRRCLIGAQLMFKNMLSAVLRAPLRWIDTVPQGRILNRFTVDFDMVDYDIGNEWAWGVGDAFNLFGIIATGLVTFQVSIYISILMLKADSSYHHI